MAIAVDSPARETGDCTGHQADQRGVQRTPAAPGCDAGSFEWEQPSFCFDDGPPKTPRTRFDVAAAGVAIDPNTPGPIVVDDGGNVGACFVSGQIVDTELADNGCVRATPLGCKSTIALGPASPARGAGFCGEYQGDRISIDQRGFPRSPLGPGCDAGAYEDLACDDVTDFTVSDEGALNVAIACFNQATTAGEYTITLAADIALTEPYVGAFDEFFSPIGGFWPIDQPGADLSLTIRNSTVSGLFSIQGRAASEIDIVNSTLTNVFGGLSVSASTNGVIRNTTFNGAAIDGGSPNVEVMSSYFTGECFLVVVMGPGNAGECLNGVADMVILPMADNGCLVVTPAGCVPTAAIDLDSPALGAGFCDTVTTDQRGEPRTPLGNGCDSGAFELAGYVPPELGDVDEDGDIDNDDVQALLTFLYGGGGAASLDTADINDDGEIKLDDALLLAQQVAEPG